MTPFDLNSSILPTFSLALISYFHRKLLAFDYYCMPCQLGRTRHNTQPDWVGPTSLFMKITPSLESPGPEYLQGQNYSDLHELGCDLARDELRSP